MIRGKYDAISEKIINETGADLVLLLVISPEGPGMSVSMRSPSGLLLLQTVPDALVDVANALRQDVHNLVVYPSPGKPE